MSDARVRLDPLNPGQFFACCGLFELMYRERPTLLARFVMDAARPRLAEFVMEGVDEPHLHAALTVLRQAEPEYDEGDTDVEAAVRPVGLPLQTGVLKLDWWLNEFLDKPTNLKCWAGQVTTANLFGELLRLVEDATLDLFERPCLTKAKFGVDPRSAWNTLDFGFSPNEHGRDSATFPAVEILAAIGLQGFRPDAAKRRGVRYSLWTESLPLAVARLAFRAPWDGLPHRPCAFDVEKRGQSYKYFTFAADLPKEENPEP